MTNINKNFVIGSDEECNRYKIKVCNVDLRKTLNRNLVLDIASKILGQIKEFERTSFTLKKLQ